MNNANIISKQARKPINVIYAMTWILNPFFKASAAVVVDSPPSKPSQPQPQPQLLSTHQDRLTTPSSATHTPNTTLPGVNQSTTSNGPETQPDQSVEPEPEVDSHDDVLETESTGSSSGRELRPPTTHVDERAEGQGQVILRLQRPTDKMTGYQFFYIFGLDGIGAMVLSGGINFAIAYGVLLFSFASAFYFFSFLFWHASLYFRLEFSLC